MASKKIINSILVLRIVTLLVLAGSIVVMGLNDFKLSDGTKTSFSDLHAYSYVVAVAGAGFVYTLIQLPFATYHAATGKRWLRNGCPPEFDFYADKLVSFLLATGVGVGFGVTFEVRRFLNPFFTAFAALGATDIPEEESKTSKFLDRGNIATGILLVGFATMAVTSILTSVKRSESSTSKGGIFR